MSYLYALAIERKQTEESLRENEELYRTLVQNVNEYIYRIEYRADKPYSVYHSPKCLDITGYSSEEYDNNSNLSLDIVHPDDRETVLSFLDDIQEWKILSKTP